MAIPNAATPPWRGRRLTRIVLLLAAAAVLSYAAVLFGVARDFGYLNISILTGAPDGHYHELAERLSKRAKLGRGRLTVVTTAGSVQNVQDLKGGDCDANFAFIQDGTPIPDNSNLVLLGRLPNQESLLILSKPDRKIQSFTELRGSSIGIGPEGSGTAFLMRTLFESPDLRALNIVLSAHEWHDQARLVSEGLLDLAAFVMQEDAPLLHNIIVQYALNIAAPVDMRGLVARYPWLSIGQIPEGRYSIIGPNPPVDISVARVSTLVVANACAKRADRVALLMLLASELPGFVQINPPKTISISSALPLADEAQHFFVTGEPELADRYFPWLVNIMSPAYWIYFVMATTGLFKGMMFYSRFCLWRIDHTREKLETELAAFFAHGTTRSQMRSALPTDTPMRQEKAQTLMLQFKILCKRCRSQINSLTTPLGDEMLFRYQEALIDEAMTVVDHILRQSTS